MAGPNLVIVCASLGLEPQIAKRNKLLPINDNKTAVICGICLLILGFHAPAKQIK